LKQPPCLATIRNIGYDVSPGSSTVGSRSLGLVIPKITAAFKQVKSMSDRWLIDNMRIDFWVRFVSVVLAVIMAGVVVLFGSWSWRNYQAWTGVSDFTEWVHSPGTLTSLEILPQSSFWGSRHRITCAYRYDYAGQAYTGNQFTLEFPRRKMTLEAAKMRAESVLGISEKAQWRRLTGEIDSGWAIAADGLAIQIRHSPLRPQFATLDSAAPMHASLYWALIIFQALIAVAASLVFLICLLFTTYSSDPLKDAHFRAEMFGKHGLSKLRTWAVSLTYFRFVRGVDGGMLAHPDALMVDLRATTSQDLKQICTALGVADVPQSDHSTQPEAAAELSDSLLHQIITSGKALIAGVRVSISHHSGLLSLTINDEQLPYEVTEAAVAAALRVEQRLAPLADRIIDPPHDNRHCICPRYYPSFWEPTATQHRAPL